MKRIILILLAVFSCYTANCQKDTTDLIYKSIRQVYRGAYTKSALMTDSQYYETTKSSFRYNKPIYVQGKLLGGETLGNPSVSGMLLKSTTAGVRSWGWPAYVRNYNLTDTFSVLRTVPAGKIGNYTRSVTGYYSKIDSVYDHTNGYLISNNYGYCFNIDKNNAYGFLVTKNYATGSGFVTGKNYGKGFCVYENFDKSLGFYCYINYYGGKSFSVFSNRGTGFHVRNERHITSSTDTVKSFSVEYMSSEKMYIDSIGLSHGEIPSATGFDTTVNLSVNLTADVWQKVTNSTNNLWSLSNTASYMTFSADTIKNTYAGKYEYSFSLSANGKDGATYEYRVMKKTGTTVSVIRKIKITGGGVNVERIINCSPLLAAGDKVWVEVRFIGSPTGSPISIFGSYFTAKAVYLSL